MQNVGDVERVGRTVVGLAMLAAGAAAPRALRWPLRFLGAGVALTGVTGWCPVYRYTGVTSLGGPGDRPDEAMRARLADAGHDRRRCDVGATRRRGRAVSPSTISALDTLAGARHADPFSVLGPHVEHGRVVIRAIFPSAASVAVTRDRSIRPSR